MKLRKYGADFQYSTDNAPPTSSAMLLQGNEPEEVFGGRWRGLVDSFEMSMSASPDTGRSVRHITLRSRPLDLVLGCLGISAGHDHGAESQRARP